MTEVKELLERGLERFDPSADRGLDRTWDRVRRRQRNRRITAAIVAVVVFGSTATGIWVSLRVNRTIPLTQRPTASAFPPSLVAKDLVIQESTRANPECPPISMVSGKKLLAASSGDCERSLARVASGTLYGWISPIAIDVWPETAFVAYNTWTPGGILRLGGQPSIRLRTSSSDELYEAQAAASFAWKPVGRIFAYFAITGEDDGGLPIGHVIVRPGSFVISHVSPVQWTTRADRWIVAAWAQDRLLVYQMLEGEALRLFVLDGPGEMRPLGPPDTNVRLVAVSPDGSQAFVSLGDGGEIVAVYDLASGRELSRLDMTGLIDSQTGSSFSVYYAGSWLGTTVAADGGPGLMLFHVIDGRVEVANVLRIEGGINEPQLMPAVDERVAGWQHLQVDGKDRYRWLDCRLEALSCEAGPLTATPLYVVYNPSRPEK